MNFEIGDIHTGCPKKTATLILLQSPITRSKLNIFERFKNQKNRAVKTS